MKNLFMLVDGSPQRYNGEILKRVVGDKVVKVISNPTEDDLKEFGYMELITSDIPDYNENVQTLTASYTIENNSIYETFKVIDIPELEETN